MGKEEVNGSQTNTGSHSRIGNDALRLKCDGTCKTIALCLAQQAASLTEPYSPALPPPLQQKRTEGQVKMWSYHQVIN